MWWWWPSSVAGAVASLGAYLSPLIMICMSSL